MNHSSFDRVDVPASCKKKHFMNENYCIAVSYVDLSDSIAVGKAMHTLLSSHSILLPRCHRQSVCIGIEMEVIDVYLSLGGELILLTYSLLIIQYTIIYLAATTRPNKSW